MLQNHDASSELYGRLVAASRAFVDSMQSSADPCTARPEDCTNGPYAPYNLQSSVTVLGDAFLRRGNQLLRAGDVAAATALIGYAQGTYAQLRVPENAARTQSWPDLAALELREARVRQLASGEPLDDAALLGAGDYGRAYDCSSCHGRAAPRSLLP
jgi:hypothetical protein